MSAVAAFVAGRRSKFVVLALWIVTIGALGPFIGKFEDAQETEPSSFLPADAESTEA